MLWVIERQKQRLVMPYIKQNNVLCDLKSIETQTILEETNSTVL